MDKLTREDLYSLEQYHEVRSEFRNKVMEHKKSRRLAIGEHVNLYFEDRLTMQYQIQEMLRIEKIFQAEGIQEELDVYNPLVPDGSNWKATMMIEYAEDAEKKAALKELVGIEETLWVSVEGEKAFAIANEDLERSTPDKTSSVHFVRFELTQAMKEKVKQGGSLHFGIDHPKYSHTVVVAQQVYQSLLNDLD